MHPVLFKLGSWTFYSYGFLTVAAFFTAFSLARKKRSGIGVSREALSDLFLVLFVSGVLGARLFYVLQHLEDFKGRWWGSLMIHEGGLVWYGGFLTAAAAGFLTAYVRRWPLLKLADFLSPFLALAQSIGRLGCFLNGCCYGKPTNVFWAMRFPGDVPRHPAPLYEAAACLVIFSVLLKFVERARHRPGTAFVLYLLFYTAARFVIEFFRGDQVLLAWLSPPQWTSLVLFLGGLFLYGLLRKKSVR